MAHIYTTFDPMKNEQIEAYIAVRIAPNGSVISATVSKSSHFSPFDEAVRRAAERTVYAPALFRCATVSSLYKFAGVAGPAP